MIQKIIDFFKKLFGIKTEEPASKTETAEKSYEKKALLTFTEIKFKNAIEKALPNGYKLYPQINLASIIKRTDEHKYQNELYRNVDFCVFNEKYIPQVIIEINDKTHNEKSRQARDYKVKDICAKANIPLITFWTDYGVNESYIEKKINEVLK